MEARHAALLLSAEELEKKIQLKVSSSCCLYSVHTCTCIMRVACVNYSLYGRESIKHALLPPSLPLSFFFHQIFSALARAIVTQQYILVLTAHS